MSEVIGQEIKDAKTVILSGPSHAEEVGRGVPTAIVAASVISKRRNLFRIYSCHRNLEFTPTRMLSEWSLEVP